MKDNKPWYEKISIWITIVAGICAILGISVLGGKSIFNGVGTDNASINFENNKIGDQSTIILSDGDIINYENVDSENMKKSQSDDKWTSNITEQYNELQQVDNEGNNLSEEELLIKQNWDIIQKLKSEYSDENTQIIGRDGVNINFYEKSAYLYHNLSKTGISDVLHGNKVKPDKVIIMDYQSDNILYTFMPESNHISYYHDNQNKFYCVVCCKDYNIYVSPPIMAIEKIGTNIIDLCLDKEEDKYTPLFQMRAYRYNIPRDHFMYILSSDYIIDIYCEKKYNDDNINTFYNVDILDSGILSINGYNYVSLNTNYIMNFSLYHGSDLDSKLSNVIVDGNVTNSNLIDVCFPINNENNIEN